jgi:type VI secretion system protein ImpJ
VEPTDPTDEAQGDAPRPQAPVAVRAHELPLPVQWHEGMLLAPQHFQQLVLRQDALLHYHALLLAPFHWGIRRLRHDPETLVHGVFRVLELEAVMPDGLVVSWRHGDGGELAVRLAPQLEAIRQRPATVQLEVAARLPGLAPVDGEMARYDSLEGELVADENTGDGDLRVPRLRPRPRLELTDEAPARYTSLPLARIAYSNEKFDLDPSYVPPTLAVPRDSTLGEMCAAIARRLREKAVFLQGQVRSPVLAARPPQLLDTKMLIASLVEGLPAFEAVLGTNLSHPYPLYLALCSLVGHVAAVGFGLLPPELAPYDHRDLYGSFEQARDFLFRALDEGILESYKGFPFFLKQGVFFIRFDPDWSERSLVLGVRGREGASEAEVLAWVEGCQMASRPKLPALTSKRVAGLARQRIDGEGDLVPGRGVTLFALTPDPEFIVPGEWLAIRNLDDREGRHRPVEIVLYVSNKPRE